MVPAASFTRRVGVTPSRRGAAASRPVCYPSLTRRVGVTGRASQSRDPPYKTAGSHPLDGTDAEQVERLLHDAADEIDQ
jgi:hypothetical protein